MKLELGSYWIRLSNDEEPPYRITGKYLFFCEDKNKLIRIASDEIEKHGFHKAKVNSELLTGQTDYVLCLYYKDDSRKLELAERNRLEYRVKYRYWKSDEATLQGHYSKKFLKRLSEPEQEHFIKEKVVIE